MARRPEAYSHLTNALFNLLHDHLRAAGSVADPRSHLQDCIGCTLSEAQALVDHLTSLLSSGGDKPEGGGAATPAVPDFDFASAASATIPGSTGGNGATRHPQVSPEANILKKPDIFLDGAAADIVDLLANELKSQPVTDKGVGLDEGVKTLASALAQAIAADRNRYQDKLAVFISGLEQSAPVSFLLDDHGEIVAATPMAAALDSSCPVFASSGRLRIKTAVERARFEAAIAKISAQTKAGKDDVEILLIEPSEAAQDVNDDNAIAAAKVNRHAKPRPAYSLTIRTLPLRLAPVPVGVGCKRATPWVCLRSRDLMDAPSVQWLRSVMKLSKSEAPLVRALMQGMSVSDHAKARGVTVDAEHAHLKSVFRKVGCHGQNDLILTITALHGPSFRQLSPVQLSGNAI